MVYRLKQSRQNIRQAVDEFLPNLVLNDITITPYTEELELIGDLNMSQIECEWYL